MPKLPQNIQSAAEDATLNDFSAIPGGTYRVRVKEIDTKKKSSNGNDMWTIQLQVLGGPNDLDDTQFAKRVVFDRITLTEAAAWKAKEVFAALGFTLDSDADELVGEVCQVVISQGEIESGSKKGQIGNNVDRWLADTDGEPDLVGASSGAAKKTASSRRGAKKDDF